MSVEINFGGTCRDISKLPVSEGDVKAFFLDKIVPAMWDDFSKNLAVAKARGAQRVVSVDILERGCEIGGSVTIKF